MKQMDLFPTVGKVSKILFFIWISRHQALGRQYPVFFHVAYFIKYLSIVYLSQILGCAEAI